MTLSTKKWRRTISEYCTLSSYIVKHRLHVWARRRERNKIAAEKCRNKRKKAVERLYSESELVAVQNTRYKEEFQRLEAEYR